MKKILSTLVMVLFGVSVSFAQYVFESLATNTGFYIYNVAAKGYIKNNNGQMMLVNNISDASVWQFTTTNGKNVAISNEGKYIKAEGAAGNKLGMQYPGASKTGTTSLSTSSFQMTLEGDKSGYTFGVSKYYILSGSYNYYFAYANSKFITNQSKNDQSKWQLVSERQVDNTITLSPNPLTIDAIEGGEAVSSQFNVNYAGSPKSIIVTDGTKTLTIGTLAASQHTIKVSYQVAADKSQTFTLIDGANESNKVTFSFSPSNTSTLSLTVSTTADSGDATDNEKEQITIIGNVVSLAHQEISWTQNFSALSLTSAAITLDAKAVDKDGNPTGKTVTYSLSSTGVVKIVSGKLYVLTEGTTSITAKVAKDATYVGAQKTLTINVSGIPVDAQTITTSNAAASGIYTGTIGGPSADYPFHREKREVNLSRCFNSSNEALFDSLYIFGITTNTNGKLVSYKGTDNVQYNNVPEIYTPSTTVTCNATTPCYVYAKSGNTYVHKRTFDATKTRYDWGTKQNTKHIYFTGYCPFAYMGATPTEEGWMYFTGGNTDVDIYLDSCQIMGRYKTQTGKNGGQEQYILKLYADAATLGGVKPNNSFMSGLSSPFVFTSTTKDEGKSYKPHFHIAGKNHLQGQLGSYITNSVAYVNIYLTELEMDPDIKNVYTYSSPISIKPTDIGQYTDLELTDTWKDGVITNGYLKLDANKGTYASEKVPVIDMGSPNSSLTINGGQYHVRNAAADGNYACNMAIAYRLFAKVAEKSGQKILLHLYGFGGDRTDCKVIINSGTFTMYKNMYPSLGIDQYIDQDNFLDLRLPAGNGESKINGGTFNGISHVFLCNRANSTGGSPINARDRWLCLQDVEVSSINADGTAQVEIPTPFDRGYTGEPKVCYDLSSANSVISGNQYGAQSLNAYTKEIDGVSKTVVSLLLPGQACSSGGCIDCEKQTETVVFQWAPALPQFEATKEVSAGTESINIGGTTKVEVEPEGEDVDFKTYQLMYMDLAGMEDYMLELPTQEATLAFADENMPRGQFTNEDSYIIERHLNILKTVQADTWYTFTAPFDVASVSVIETKNETTIAKKDRTTAIEKQAQDNLEIMYNIQNFIIPDELGRASSLMFTSMLNLGSVNAKPFVLKHYDGTNLFTSNYYLYELKNTIFESDVVGENLAIEWVPVKRNSGEALMIKGKTYAIQFPYCPMCNDLDSRDYYDYWSNKLILFYGQGPQEIYGTSTSPASPTLESAKGTLVGNPTFRDYTLAANAGYVHNPSNDIFELSTKKYTLKPTEGYMLYNSPTSRMPERISRSGKMIYSDNTTTDTEGVPTISDRTSLMLFDAMDGVEILSLSEQVVLVYNLQGNLIFRQQMTAGEQIYVATGSGIFVVRGESETIKVMVD